MLNIKESNQCEMPKSTRRLSVKDNLLAQKTHLEEKLISVNKALEIFEKYPEFSEALETLNNAM